MSTQKMNEFSNTAPGNHHFKLAHENAVWISVDSICIPPGAPTANHPSYIHTHCVETHKHLKQKRFADQNHLKESQTHQNLSFSLSSAILIHVMISVFLQLNEFC